MDAKIKTLAKIHAFIKEAEGLKRLLRHSWLSDGRQESVAEHTWRMAIMALTLAPEIEFSIDISKVLKMILIHDLAEIHVGDYHAFKTVPTNKHQLEQQAFKKLTAKLAKKTAAELMMLWQEFEQGKTNEAKFAIALDKLEVLIQHNQARLSTWDEKEYDFNYYYAYDKVAFSKVLTIFRDLVLAETIAKIDLEPTR